MSYSASERHVLVKVLDYGGGVDWGGADARGSHREAAKKLIERGLLQGEYRNTSLTAKGMKAAKAIDARQQAAKAAAFARDKRGFEGR